MRKRIINSYFALLVSVIIIFTLIPSFAMATETLNAFEGLNTSNFNGADISVTKQFSTNKVFGGLSSGTYISWDNVNFDEVPENIELEYSSPNNILSFEVRLDNPGGALLAKFEDKTTGGYGNYKTQIQKCMAEVSGIHSVYVLWKGEQSNVRNVKFFSQRDVSIGYTPIDSLLLKKPYSDIQDENLAKKLSVLKQLGFLCFIKDDEFKADEKITLGEYAQGLSYFYTDSIPESNDIIFNDILQNYPGYHAINYAATMGIVEDKNNDGLLEPYEGVKSQYFLEWLLNVLGYSDEIKKSGIFQTAGKYGLISGVDVISGMDITRKIFAEIIYNSLEADYRVIVPASEKTFSYEKKVGILYKTRKVNKGTGLVEAVPATSLTNQISNLSTKNIMIDNQVYSVSSDDVYMYLGYECDYYYNNETYELLAITPSKNIKETIIGAYNGSELEYIDNSKIQYYDGKRSRTVNLDKNTAFIYNGKAADDKIRNIVNEDTFKGNIRIIENKNSTAVIIDNYRNVIITTFDIINECFTDKHTGELIQLSNGTNEYVVEKAGVLINPTLIQAGDCALMYRSKNKTGEIITRIVIDGFKTVEDCVSAVNDDEIIIEGTEYKQASEFKRSITAGLYGEFIINKYGEIVDLKEDLESDWQTVLYINSYLNDDETGVNLKIYEENGGIKFIASAESVVIDGLRRKNADEIINVLAKVEKKTPLLIKTGDAGEVTIMDTVNQGTRGVSDRLLKVAESSSYGYRAGLRCLIDKGNGGYISNPVDGNTKVISYYNLDTEKYAIEKLSSQITYKTNADGVVYTLGENLFADIFLWKNREISLTESEYPVYFTFEKTGKVINEDDEPITYIEGYAAGKYVRYVVDKYIDADEKAALEERIEKLTPGDCMSVVIDADNNLASMEMYCYTNGAKDNGAGESVLYIDGEDYVCRKSVQATDTSAAKVRCYGTVVDYEDSFFIVKYPDGKSEYINVGGNNTTLVRVSKNGTRFDVSTNSTGKDILAADPKGARVFCYIYNGNVQDIVLYDTNCFE